MHALTSRVLLMSHHQNSSIPFRAISEEEEKREWKFSENEKGKEEAKIFMIKFALFLLKFHRLLSGRNYSSFFMPFVFGGERKFC